MDRDQFFLGDSTCNFLIRSHSMLIGPLDIVELSPKVVVRSNFFIFLGFFRFIIFILDYVLISLMFLDYRLFSRRGMFSLSI